MDTGSSSSGVPPVEEFLGDSAPGPERWRGLWLADLRFPITSHRGGLVGWLLVLVKRLVQPLARLLTAELAERQRRFNLVLLDYHQDGRNVAQELRDRGEEILADLRVVQESLARDLATLQGDFRRDIADIRTGFEDVDRRCCHLEMVFEEGLEEVMRHNDALFFRVDQKLDRYRREARVLTQQLGVALAELETADGAPKPLERAWGEGTYVDLEDRYRGTEEEVRGRIEPYLGRLPAGGRAVDLGCGRGEAVELLGERGFSVIGVDASAQMVEHCRRKGLEVVERDLLAYLGEVEEGSFDAVLSFHVVEHLPAPAVDRLVRLAWRALRPGGVLVLETPNPLSLVVSAQSFWLDPTHRRPVHPSWLRFLFERIGFNDVEMIPLRPFDEQTRLPEIDLTGLSGDGRLVADGANRLRDRLDDLLFGHQDYGMIGRRDGSSAELPG